MQYLIYLRLCQRTFMALSYQQTSGVKKNSNKFQNVCKAMLLICFICDVDAKTEPYIIQLFPDDHSFLVDWNNAQSMDNNTTHSYFNKYCGNYVYHEMCKNPSGDMYNGKGAKKKMKDKHWMDASYVCPLLAWQYKVLFTLYALPSKDDKNSCPMTLYYYCKKAMN